jgi:dTDP-4-amino-4,6-dideoxygalactose transaminase
MNAVPILVDCDAVTLNIDFADAEESFSRLSAARCPDYVVEVVGIIPVHWRCDGGLDKLREFRRLTICGSSKTQLMPFPAAW